MEDALLVVSRVVKRYRSGVLANRGISFSVRLGEVVGIFGPNGAGKSTLIHQIVGLLPPTSGHIVVCGVDVDKSPGRVKTHIGFMPQQPARFGHIELRRALWITGVLRGCSLRDARREADEFLVHFDLEAYRRTLLPHLSGGLKRLAAIGLAMMGKPRLLILDEPTNDLDPVQRRRLWALVRDYARTGEHSVLLVTHNLAEAERIIDRMIVVDEGVVVAEGRPGELSRTILGHYVSVEVVFADPAAAAACAQVFPALRTDDRRLHGLVAKDVAQQMTSYLLASYGADEIERVSIGRASLEELYLYLNVQNQGGTGARARLPDTS